MNVAPYGSFPIGHPLKPIDPADGISGDPSNAPHQPETPLRPRAFLQTKDPKTLPSPLQAKSARDKAKSVYPFLIFSQTPNRGMPRGCLYTQNFVFELGAKIALR